MNVCVCVRAAVSFPRGSILRALARHRIDCIECVSFNCLVVYRIRNIRVYTLHSRRPPKNLIYRNDFIYTNTMVIYYFVAELNTMVF